MDVAAVLYPPLFIGVGYSSINTPSSVLSSILKDENGTSFGENPLICRLLKKEVFNLRPFLHLSRYTKYNNIWNVSIKYLFVPELLKQTHPGHLLEPTVLVRCSDTDICVLSHLEKYEEVTKKSE